MRKIGLLCGIVVLSVELGACGGSDQTSSAPAAGSGTPWGPGLGVTRDVAEAYFNNVGQPINWPSESLLANGTPRVFANTPAGNCIVELDGESSNIVDVDTICMVPLGTDQADLGAAGTYLYGSAYLADNDSAIHTWFQSEVAKDTSATTEVDDTMVFGNTSIEFQVHGVIGSMAITAKRT